MASAATGVEAVAQTCSGSPAHSMTRLAVQPSFMWASMKDAGTSDPMIPASKIPKNSQDPMSVSNSPAA